MTDLTVLKAALGALEFAGRHTKELRDAWERGAIGEFDKQGGTRSNRNVDVEVAVREALPALRDLITRMEADKHYGGASAIDGEKREHILAPTAGENPVTPAMREPGMDKHSDVPGLLRGMIAKCGGFEKKHEPIVQEYAGYIHKTLAAMQPTPRGEVDYWLCCGSIEYGAHKPGCNEHLMGHPERRRFGTATEHSKWQHLTASAKPNGDK